MPVRRCWRHDQHHATARHFAPVETSGLARVRAAVALVRHDGSSGDRRRTRDVDLIHRSDRRAQVSFMRMFGLGLGPAVLVEARLVRMVLLPAVMRVTGERNRWSPGPLATLDDRIGIDDDGPRVAASTASDAPLAVNECAVDHVTKVTRSVT